MKEQRERHVECLPRECLVFVGCERVPMSGMIWVTEGGGDSRLSFTAQLHWTWGPNIGGDEL